jgi:two-component sensor histidine kinase
MIPNALRGPLLGRLGFRLMTAVAIALTPLALLAYVQTQKFETEAQARWESALFGETLLAAPPQIDAISRAQGLAAATAVSVLPVIADGLACNDVMQKLVSTENTISFAGFIPPDGNMTCSSTGAPYSFAGSPGLLKLNADPRPVMTVNPKGPISGESVLIFSHPVYDAADRVLGYISLSLPHRALERRASIPLDGDHQLAGPLALVTFDGEGTVLTAVYGIDTVAERLPVDRPLATFVSKPPSTFLARTPTGDRRTFAVLAIVPGSLYVLGSWPPSVAVATPLAGWLPLWAFPLLMWVASMLVAWLAAEHQVLRHVRSLRRSIIAFAGGHRMVDPPELWAAPNELRDVGDAYESMMTSVMHDEAELENSLRQKEVLLREVHHRVKNNLQLIASIMNLQMRKSVAPEAHQLLKGLHDRVMSLATVHRELYQTSGLTDVQADELLQTIVAQVVRMGASTDRQIDTKTSFAHIRLTPDQAVPLSLMLTEALTNALKHSATAADGRTALTVSFRHAAPGRAVLEVTNSLPSVSTPPLARDLDSSGLGHQLLSAFATQLSGKLEMGERGGMYAVTIDFPLQAADIPEESGT